MNTTIKRRMRRLLGRQGHTTRITKSLIDKQPESGNQVPPRSTMEASEARSLLLLSTS